MFAGDEQWRIHLWDAYGKQTLHPPSPALRGSHVSRILQRDLALGSKRNILHSQCLFIRLEPLAVAPYCSSLVWLGNRISHPQEMPPSGPGRDPSISTPGERICVCAHTCMCVWWCWGGGDSGMLPSLQVRKRS